MKTLAFKELSINPELVRERKRGGGGDPPRARTNEDRTLPQPLSILLQRKQGNEGLLTFEMLENVSLTLAREKSALRKCGSFISLRRFPPNFSTRFKLVFALPPSPPPRRGFKYFNCPRKWEGKLRSISANKFASWNSHARAANLFVINAEPEV